MNPSKRSFCAAPASLLLGSLLLPKQSNANQARQIDSLFEAKLALTGRGGTGVQELLLRMHEDSPASITIQVAGETRRTRYTVRAYRPNPATLPSPMAAVKSPLGVEIRVAQSNNDSDWWIDSESNLLLADGSSASLQHSDGSLHQLSYLRSLSRAEWDATQLKQPAKPDQTCCNATGQSTGSGNCVTVSCGRYLITVCNSCAQLPGCGWICAMTP